MSLKAHSSSIIFTLLAFFGSSAFANSSDERADNPRRSENPSVLTVVSADGKSRDLEFGFVVDTYHVMSGHLLVGGRRGTIFAESLPIPLKDGDSVLANRMMAERYAQSARDEPGPVAVIEVDVNRKPTEQDLEANRMPTELTSVIDEHPAYEADGTPTPADSGFIMISR